MRNSPTKLLWLLPLVLAAACDDKPKADAGKAKSGDAKSGDAKSGDAKSGDAKSGDAKSGDAKSDAEPKPKGDPLPALDTAEAAKAVKALEAASEGMRPLLAAQALAELERTRLGPSFSAGLEALANAAPDQRPMLMAKAIQANIAMLDAACVANGAKTMQSLATMAPDAREDALWDACKFEKLGLVTREQAKGNDPIAILVSHMAFAKLAAHGEVDPSERALLLTLSKAKPSDG